MLSEIYKIKKLLDEAQDVFNSLSPKAQEYVNSLHNENSQLGYCLRWGAMAAGETLEDLDQSLIEGKALRVGKNRIYYDKMDSSYIVEEFVCYDDYKGTNEPMYSVLDGFGGSRTQHEILFRWRHSPCSRIGNFMV